MFKRQAIVLKMTLGLVSTALLLSGADLNACLHAHVQATPLDKRQSGASSELSLSNNCGKDITAYRILARDSAGARKWATGKDDLATLTLTQPQPAGMDVFRMNTSRTVPIEPPPPGGSVSVAAAIFIDGTTEGDPEDVADILVVRQEWLAEIKEQLTILNSASDWTSALELRRRSNQLKSAVTASNDRSAFYLEELAKRQERSNATSWNTFVGDEHQRLLKLIELFERHLKTANGSQR